MKRQRKHDRESKRQRGQFMTPRRLATDIVGAQDLTSVQRVLEPSCGDGSFLQAVASRLSGAAIGRPISEDDEAGRVEIVGVEIDPEYSEKCRCALSEEESQLVGIYESDFFRLFLERNKAFGSVASGNPLDCGFDLIVGNPPFGGTFDHSIEDQLDRLFGVRFGRKIKKETYAFFIVACAELLRPNGRLVFICSDSMLTIPTMTGLRNFLMETGEIVLHDLDEFSGETNYPMFVLEYVRGGEPNSVTRQGVHISAAHIRSTPNLSWGITSKIATLFRGPSLGDLFVASSGMTTGKNEYFVRTIDAEGRIVEPYEFRYHDAPITVEYEFERARLRKLSPKRLRALRDAEERGDCERRVAIERRETPLTIQIPSVEYMPYNKANGRIIFSPPTHVIYWKDDGDAVLTFKRTGNWYLRGVGGQPYFGREGLSWQLVASRFVPRFLPSGYILDSGAPCAFPRAGVNADEALFILGWMLSPLANQVLKTVINHTRNIQSKDFERMPYPWWVNSELKEQIVATVRRMIDEARAGHQWEFDSPEIMELGESFDPSQEIYEDSCERIDRMNIQDAERMTTLFDSALST